jgi:hypothetical protein
MRIITILSALFFTFLFHCPAYGAFVQSGTGWNYPSSTLTIQLNNVQAGNLLIVAIRTNVLATTTVSSPGATWTKDASKVVSINEWNLDVWSAPNVPGGNTTITVRQSTGNAPRAVALEFSGMAADTHAHKVSSGTGTSGTASAGSVTTTVDGCLIFTTAATDSDSLGWSAGSGYTMRNDCNENQEPDQKLCTEDRGIVNAGTWSGGFSINSDTWAAVLVAYAPGVSSPPPPPPKVPNPPLILQVN